MLLQSVLLHAAWSGPFCTWKKERRSREFSNLNSGNLRSSWTKLSSNDVKWVVRVMLQAEDTFVPAVAAVFVFLYLLPEFCLSPASLEFVMLTLWQYQLIQVVTFHCTRWCSRFSYFPVLCSRGSKMIFGFLNLLHFCSFNILWTRKP